METDWLDIMYKGNIVQINGEGKIRYYCNHDDSSWCTDRCAKRIPPERRIINAKLLGVSKSKRHSKSKSKKSKTKKHLRS